jgi:hypothetical protein
VLNAPPEFRFEQGATQLQPIYATRQFNSLNNPCRYHSSLGGQSPWHLKETLHNDLKGWNVSATSPRSMYS